MYRSCATNCFHIVLTLVFSCELPRRATADDQLSLADKAALTQHLNIIANDPGWPQASVDAANGIVSKPQYSAVAWNGFFSEYFATQPFTDPLNNYLGYPTFWWFDDSVHLNLQTGLYQPLMQQNVIPDWAAAIAGGGNSFAVNPTIRQDLHNSQNMLTQIGTRSLIASSDKQTLFNGVAALIDQYPNVLKHGVTFNRSTQPYYGALRTEVDMALLSAAQTTDPSRPSFTPAVKTQISTTLGLAGDYSTLWNDHSLLYLDNNLSNAQQRAVIHNYLDSVPAQLHNVASITVNDYLGNTTAFQSQSLNFTRPYGGVNVFGLGVGAAPENSFPSDVPAGITDVFSIVVAHEINHVVDALSVQGNPVLADRRQALLSAAGNDSLNYLRSMLPNGFFQSAPQEFIASIANEWFTDSSKTVELGLVRFDAGRPQPLNQALFFAEIYSQGGDATWFYEINTAGSITRHSIPLGRDVHGHIDELTFDNLRYLFELDANGNVTGYSILAVPEPTGLVIAMQSCLCAAGFFFAQRLLRARRRLEANRIQGARDLLVFRGSKLDSR